MPMIDYVKLRYTAMIPKNFFSPLTWNQRKTDDGQPYYWRTVRGVKLRYYTESCTFTIDGKILMLLYDTQVQNVDDIYGTRTDIFLEELNAMLNRLFPVPILDVGDFTVSRIDYCFNVETPYVETYLDFLTRAFRATNSSKVNYTDEHNLSGSVYIRTEADYRDNQNKNYTINFYDKSDRLRYQIDEGQRVTKADLALAQNIFRLEVQCGYQMIKRQSSKHGISNTFGELLNYEIAYDTLCTAYALVFKGNQDADYFTYDAAKQALSGKRAALNTILVAASHNITKQKYAYGSTVAKKAGVYPYCFLPQKSSVPRLVNPMKLVAEKLHTLHILSQ